MDTVKAIVKGKLIGKHLNQKNSERLEIKRFFSAPQELEKWENIKSKIGRKKKLTKIREDNRN